MSSHPPLDVAALYRILAESAQDAIISIDEDSLVLSVNPAGERLFGYSADEIIGRPLNRLMPERFRASHGEGMSRYLRTRKRHIPWRGIQLPILTKDGREVPMDISFGEFESNGRHIFSGILRDVSERVAAEATLAANAELLQAQTIELEQQVEEAQTLGEELEQTNEALRASSAELEQARIEAVDAGARVREVLDTLTDAVSVFDREWHWRYLNPAAQAILVAMGRDPARMIGRNLWNELPELLGTRFESETRRALDSEGAVEYEEYLPTLERWFENRIVPSPNGVTAFTRDVTAVHAAADIVRTNEAEFRALANSIPTLAWMARPDGWIFWYNQRWYDYTGTTADDMEGWGWQRVHHPEALPVVLEEWTRSVNTGAPFEMTFPIRGADGAFRRFLTRVVPARDATGTITRWFGMNTDVEETSAAREAVAVAASRTDRLLQLTAVLAAAVSVEEVVAVVVTSVAALAEANNAALFASAPGTSDAVSPREAGLGNKTEFTFPQLPITAPGPSAECMRTGLPVFIESRDGAGGLLDRSPDSGEAWERPGAHGVASIPLVVGDEQIGVVSFSFDAPRAFPAADREFYLAVGRQVAQALERARLLAAERKARVEAETANRAKADFLAAMSHELRTPLNAIGGYAEIIELGIHGPVTERQQESLSRIQRSQRHLLGLINDLLNFAKLEAGRVEYEIAPVAVSAAFASLETLVAPQLAAKGLAFVRDDPATQPAVMADVDKLQQILVNLLSNAIKFTPENGTVTLTSETIGAKVFITVRDTGIGIPGDRLESIFAPFVQVNRRTGTNPGVGLGLAISRELARGMGGDLTANSTPDAGSQFRLELPAAPNV
jgi:PAS domain S-box-containing protein